MTIMDIYGRCVLGLGLSYNIEVEWIAFDLINIGNYGKAETINSAQGLRFTSDAYIGCDKFLGSFKISLDVKGRATDNVYIERYIRTIEYMEIYLEQPRTGSELYECNIFGT